MHSNDGTECNICVISVQVNYRMDLRYTLYWVENDCALKVLDYLSILKTQFQFHLLPIAFAWRHSDAPFPDDRFKLKFREPI